MLGIGSYKDKDLKYIIHQCRTGKFSLNCLSTQLFCVAVLVFVGVCQLYEEILYSVYFSITNNTNTIVTPSKDMLQSERKLLK